MNAQPRNDLDSIDRDILSSLDNRELHLILMPTEACNFRCVYCYEEFKYKRMEPQVVEGVKHWLSNRIPELRRLTLSWFGGEPLLAKDIVEDLLRHVQAEAGGRSGLQVRSDITTNAYLLTADVFRQLLELGITEYQVSLDGPARWHDKKRVRADGRPTFERIWSNLLAIRDVPGEFGVVIRLHVDNENREAMPRFIDEIVAAFGGDERFRLFVRPLSRLGGPNDGTLQILDSANEDRVMADLLYRSNAMQRGGPYGEDLSSVCYAAQANSFFVRANGRLNKCTVALEHDANQVGELNSDGSVRLDAERVQAWMRGVWSRDLTELGCPMLGLADPPAVDRIDAASVDGAPSRHSAMAR